MKKYTNRIAHPMLHTQLVKMLPSNEPIVLSETAYAAFVEMMNSDTEPTDTAKREAAEFKRTYRG